MVILGPMRVLPGKLSVSRTFGDCTAKMEKYGGNPRGVIPDPDIFKYKPDSNTDFILIGSDGIFDKMESKETSNYFWSECRTNTSQQTDATFEHVSECCGKGVDRVLRASMEKESMDNVSVVVISY
jgi:protein phosphatase 2C family protein 2/3